MLWDGLKEIEYVVACAFVAAVTVVLNALGGYSTDCAPHNRTGAHASSLRILTARVVRYFRRLRNAKPPPPRDDLLLRLRRSGSGQDPDLVTLTAEDCALPATGGNVDPSSVLHPDLAALLASSATLFTPGIKDLAPPVVRRHQSHKEYAALVGRQLRARLVGLSTVAYSGADLFGRRKQNGETRVIFSGSDVSEQTAPIPKPRHLASPTSLKHVEIGHDEHLLANKRDGETMFDQLAAPPWLGRYLAQPPVSIGDLVRHAGFTLDELRSVTDVGSHIFGPALMVFPTSLTWRMGFGPSSAVCQDVALGLCRRAGLSDQCCLCDDLAPTIPSECYYLVATDDIVTLTTKGKAVSDAIASRLDDAFRQAGVRKNGTKDVNSAGTLTAIGVDLTDGRYFTPSVDKAVLFSAMVCCLIDSVDVTPRAMKAGLGLPHWYGQLMRPLYATFYDVYRDTETADLDDVIHPSSGAEAELLAAAFLTGIVELDAAQEWSGDIVTTDATPSHGFGMNVAHTDAGTARDLAYHACHGEAFVRPTEVPGATAAEKLRRGLGYRLPVPRSAFKPIVSCKAKYVDHPGAMEATGLVMASRWVSRVSAAHNKRRVFLLDAQAVVSACRKGRSSAGSFVRPLRRAAANFLAVGTSLWLGYTPSESNPSDAPSRGFWTWRPLVSR